MKINDISVRNKLLITNMLMIIIPLAIIVIIMSILMPTLVYFINGMNPEAKLTDSLGFISVYQLQRDVSNLEKQLTVEATVLNLELSTSEVNKVYNDNNGNYKDHKQVTGQNKPHDLMTAQVLRICNSIDEPGSGAMLAVFLNEKTIYLTKGSTLEAISQVFAAVNNNSDIKKDSMINASHSGTVLTNVSKLTTGETLRIIVANPTMTSVVGGEEGASDNLVNFSDKLLITLLLIAITVVLFTDGFLAIFSAKGILEPLKKLRAATHEIRDGNLDCEINYKSKNEIGQVCSDFDEMRLRLKRSIESQQRYEENRIEMIAGISHDLGTPLTSIKGYTSGLIDGIADTPEKRAHYLKTIYNTANEMDKLVSELSMSSKLDLDKIPFYFERLDMTAFFEEGIEEISTTLARNDIVLKYENLCNGKVFASIDITQFRRAIMNIIDNCIKYKRTDEISCEVILSICTDGDDIIIVVEDNGLGVPEQEYEKIFNSFYRTDKARTNASSGSGLGLAITRQIIERHRGKIWAHKSKSDGLALNIILPILGKEETDHGDE